MTARTTPRLFYQFFVEPNYSDFLLQPDDIRRGFNASVAAFQQAEIFYRYYERHDRSKIAAWPTIKSLYLDLIKLDPNFSTVQGVATVYKHLYASGGHYELGSPMDLWGVVYPPDKIQIRMNWGDGADRGRVIVQQRKRSEISLQSALESVVRRLWPGFLPFDGTDLG